MLILYQYFYPIYFQLSMIDPTTQKSSASCTRTRTEHPLYDAGQLQQKTTSALRASFNHWIRSLPMEERFLALKVHSAPLPHTIRRFLCKFEESTNERCMEMDLGKCELSKEETNPDYKKIPRKIQKGFYDSLVLVTDGHDFLDHICFQFGLLECPEKLFDLLMATFDTSSPKPMLQALRNKTTAQKINERIMKAKNKEEAMIEILNFLRQEVFLRFREAMLDVQFLAKNLEQQKRRKKQFNTHWKHFSHQQRYNLLLLNYPNISELHKWLTVNDIFLSMEELSLEIEELLKLEKNDFCNRIFKCKFKKSITAIIDYYELVYQLWKKEVDRCKKKKGSKFPNNEKEAKNGGKVEVKEKEFAKKQKNKGHKKSNSLESNETNVTDNEKYIEKHEKPQFMEENFDKEEEFHNFKSLEKEEVLPERQVPRKQKQQKGRNRQKNNKTKNQQKQKEKYEPQPMKSKIVQASQISNEPCFINPETNKPKIEIKDPKIARYHQQIKQVHLARLSQQLQDMSDKTSEQANRYHERRVIAFQRIQYLLAFYNISIRLFGSCASGIAIKNSDIDIAVDNSILTLYDYLPENLKLLGALESLQQVFASQPCFTYIKLIKTASIPVIKLTIDTSLEFLNPNYGQPYFNLNRKHFSGPIQADITIQTLNKLSECNHLGLISTEAINLWLGEIHSLHTIVIFMKQIFKNHRFNITYQGGLNTFAMIVLLVSYIRHKKLEEETNSALVLEKILRFYAQEFNERQFGIDLLRHKKGEIFYKKEDSKAGNAKDAADLEILDPKCQGKIMTRNCYQFLEMKKLFREILAKCYDEPYLDAHRLRDTLTHYSHQVLLERLNKTKDDRNVFIEFLTF